ncbi:hypothetical protein AQJ66_27980 [Streptomyces bungoensis]|uniref:Uncharacterized protein n=1 Tax=Streptomyces bungoensis TaxID=285568 RepID=A0A124I289_9ACTN|nr:hypothetical protein [Streptomyces bungoensis]KUN79796.1 hypothetical protein AQJ66_27980 [Streptomyces bungoensis]
MTTFGPLLWTDVTSLPFSTKDYPERTSASVNRVAVFGGNGSVSASVLAKIGSSVSVGDHYVCTPYYKGVAPQSPTAQPLAAGSDKPAPSPDLTPLQVTVER